MKTEVAEPLLWKGMQETPESSHVLHAKPLLNCAPIPVQRACLASLHPCPVKCMKANLISSLSLQNKTCLTTNSSSRNSSSKILAPVTSATRSQKLIVRGEVEPCHVFSASCTCVIYPIPVTWTPSLYFLAVLMSFRKVSVGGWYDIMNNARSSFLRPPLLKILSL